MQNTPKATKGTTPPVQNTGIRIKQEERQWFNHSPMIANIMFARTKERRMTQKMLAEKMNCTRQFISKTLKGRKRLSIETISKLEYAFYIHFLQMDKSSYFHKCNDKKK